MMTNSLLKHRNLPELLRFVPPYSKLSLAQDYILCHLSAPMDEATIQSMKLRFGFGAVSPSLIKIHKGYLAK